MRKAIIFLILFFITIDFANAEFFWKKVEELPEIQFNAVAVDDFGTVYAGTEDDGIYISTDAAWQKKLKGKSVNDIVVEATGKVYVATDAEGVYYTQNSGATWRQKSDGLEPNGLDKIQIYSLARDSSGVLYAGSRNAGLYMSTDNANTWTRLAESTFTDYDIVQAIEINSSGRVFTGVYNKGLFFSDDPEQSWTMKTFGEEGQENNVMSLGIITPMDNPEYVFTGMNHNGIFRSTDNGDTWVQDTGGVAKKVFNYYCFAVEDNGNIWTGTHQARLYMSDDRGDTWQQKANALTGLKIYGLAFGPDNAFYAATDEGLYERVEVVGSLSLQISRDPGESNVFGWGEGVDFTVKVIDNEKNPVKDAVVYIDDRMNDASDVRFSDEDGIIEYSTSVPSGTERDTYMVEFQAKKDKYSDSRIFKSPVVVRPDDSLTLALNVVPEEKTTIDISDNVEFEITVLDFKDKPVKQAKVIINDSLNGSDIELFSNDNGIAKYTLQVPEGAVTGTYNLRFSADKDGYEGSVIAKRTVELRYNPALAMKIKVQPKEKPIVKITDLLKFTVLVTDFEDNPLEAATVYVVDSMMITTQEITTDENGEAEYLINVPHGISPGDYRFEFRATKKGYYNTSKVEKFAEVEDAGLVRANADSYGLRIFPNPVNSLLNIDFSTENADHFMVEIFDELGTVHYSEKISNYSGTANSIQIPVEYLKSGAYFVRIINGNEFIIQKFIKIE